MVNEKKTIVLERTYKADLDDVWELWTTKEGLESWWGPDEFFVKVDRLELRVGGALEYDMTTKNADIIKYLVQAGVKATSRIRAVFTQIEPRVRLAYVTKADFVAGVEPEDTTTRVAFHAVRGGTQVVITADVMRSDEMTRNMQLGWTQELEKLAGALGE